MSGQLGWQDELRRAERDYQRQLGWGQRRALRAQRNREESARELTGRGRRGKPRKPKLGIDLPGRLGWTLPGAGATVHLDVQPEFRAPTVQVCGLYPFSAGSSMALIGVPLGPDLDGRGEVCCDPVSWFLAGLINNPSGFVLGRPGIGKSTLLRHIVALLPYKGILPLVLSDLKPDYVDVIEALDGQVIKVGRGHGRVNPLDPGPMAARLDELPELNRERVLATIRGRRMNVMAGLCGLALGSELEAHEASILSTAMELWDAEHGHQVPVIADIRAIIEARPPRLAMIAQDGGEPARYADRTRRLLDAVIALDAGSATFGGVFAGHTTVPLEMDRPVVFDLSDFEGLDEKLQAGVQLVCWSYGSSAVDAAKALAEAGLAPRRTYLLVMDELWRTLRAAEFMVDRVDEITRLNRTLSIGQLLCTHTMADLKLHSDAATEKAWGFVARSEIVFLGGLNPGEMGNLESVFAISGKETDMLTSWAEPGEINPVTGTVGVPRGRAKFLLKVGKKTGLPFQLELMPCEIEVNDTNKAWRDTAAAMSRHTDALDDLLDPYRAEPDDHTTDRPDRPDGLADLDGLAGLDDLDGRR